MKKKIATMLVSVAVIITSLVSVYQAYDTWPEKTEKQKEDVIQKSSVLCEQIEKECEQGLNHNATAQNSEAGSLVEDLHTYGEEKVVRSLIVNFGKKSVDPYSPNNPRFGYGWLDQRHIQFMVDEYHAFGSYVSLLREAGFDSVDYTPAIKESLAHGEITQTEADALLKGNMVITKRAAQAIANNINNPYFTPSVPNCVKMYQSGNYTAADSEVKVTDYYTVMYSVTGTDVYREADSEKVLLTDIEAGLPIQITGITDNGFYRVTIAGTTYYIAGNELTTGK